MVVEDVGLSQSESIIHLAGAREREVSPIPLDVPVSGSEEKVRLANPKLV